MLTILSVAEATNFSFDTTTVFDTLYIIGKSDDGTQVCIIDSIRNRYACNSDGSWSNFATFNTDSVTGKIFAGSSYNLCILSYNDSIVEERCTTFVVPAEDNYIYHVIDSEWVKNNIQVGKSIFNYDTSQTSNIGTCSKPFDTLFVKTISIRSGDSCITLTDLNNKYLATLAGFYFDGSPLRRSYKFVVPFDSASALGIEYFYRVPPESVYSIKFVVNGSGDTTSVNIGTDEAGSNIFPTGIDLNKNDTLEIIIPSTMNTQYGGFDLTIIVKSLIFGFTTGGIYKYFEYGTKGNIPILDSRDFFTGLISDSTDLGNGPFFVTGQWIARFISENGRWPIYGDIYDTLCAKYPGSIIRMWLFKDVETMSGNLYSAHINQHCADYPLRIAYSNDDYGHLTTRFYRHDKIIAYKPIMFNALGSFVTGRRLSCALY